MLTSRLCPSVAAAFCVCVSAGAWADPSSLSITSSPTFAIDNAYDISFHQAPGQNATCNFALQTGLDGAPTIVSPGTAPRLVARDTTIALVNTSDQDLLVDTIIYTLSNGGAAQDVVGPTVEADLAYVGDARGSKSGHPTRVLAHASVSVNVPLEAHRSGAQLTLWCQPVSEFEANLHRRFRYCGIRDYGF